MREIVNLTRQNWDEIDRQMLEAGVYTEFYEVEEWKDEKVGCWLLYHTINDRDTRKLYWLHDEVKNIIRNSREYYNDLIPKDDFLEFDERAADV